MPRVATFRRQPLLPSLDNMTTKMARARLLSEQPQKKTPHRELDWTDYFLQHMNRVEKQYGQRALLIELRLRLDAVGYKEYADQRGLFIRRMMWLLHDSRRQPDDLDLGMEPEDIRCLKEMIIWAMSQRQPAFPGPSLCPKELRPPTEKELQIARFLHRLDETADDTLLRKLVFRGVGTCDLRQYEFDFMSDNALSLAYHDKVNWEFTFTPNQRGYAERLLIGDQRELPLIGILQRPLRPRLDIAKAFRKQVGELCVTPKNEDPLQMEMF